MIRFLCFIDLEVIMKVYEYTVSFANGRALQH